MKGVLKAALWCAAVAHLAFGVAGAVFPRWFYSVVPPWPPPSRTSIAICPSSFRSASSECGHALVRMGHVAAGDNPPGDLVAPTVMLLFGMFLLVTGMVAREEDRTAGHRE